MSKAYYDDFHEVSSEYGGADDDNVSKQSEPADYKRRANYVNGPKVWRKMDNPANPYDDSFGRWRRHTIKFYSSGPTGSSIRNAKTGHFDSENSLVGSSDEDYKFVVNYTTLNRQNPTKAFYSTPAEFESHNRAKLNPNVVKKWEEKQGGWYDHHKQTTKQMYTVIRG